MVVFDHVDGYSETAETQEIFHLGNCFPKAWHREDICSAAWAILLHKFHQKDRVSFALLPNLNSNSQSDNIRSSQEDADGTKKEFRILNYDILATSQLQDVVSSRFQTFASTATLHNDSARTAIAFSHQDGFLSSYGRPIRASDKPGSELPGLANKFEAVVVISFTADKGSFKILHHGQKISTAHTHAVATSFRKILESFGADPHCRIKELNLISQKDKQRMVSWNPRTSFRYFSCLHHLVEATARALPTAEAICSWDGSMTHGRLEKLSSVLALDLQKQGVTPGELVPFACEKTKWTVVALMGILKAGAAVVPLDPSYPEARMREIVSATGAKVAVASQNCTKNVQVLELIVVVVSESTLPKDRELEAAEYVPPSVKYDDPVYALFTSGSTGKPKGMIHEHGGICAHTLAHGQLLGHSGARVFASSAHAFDVAMFDIFTTLVFGGCVCIPSESERRGDICGAINRLNADHAFLTPTVAGLICPSDVPGLKTVIVGGEALPASTLKRWAEQVKIFQIYGPAEAGICLAQAMNEVDDQPETVGKPLRYCSCWLVDPDNDNVLAPFGAIGELVVAAGPSLSRGYLNDQVKTSQVFRRGLDLEWTKALGLENERFFKTGDLLKYNAMSLDGSLAFVGRKDSQLKLRGQRMEPEEVECQLLTMAEISSAVVGRPSRGSFSGKLVAVLHLQRSQKTSGSRQGSESLVISQVRIPQDVIRKHLSGTLPAYMIPTEFLEIAEMPMTPSLKVDRKRILAWLSSVERRATTITDPAIIEGLGSVINTGDHAALAISVKVAELVAGQDSIKRQQLEGHDFLLHRSGTSSIDIMSISLFLQKRFAVKLPSDVLWSSSTSIRTLASWVEGSRINGEGNRADHQNESHPFEEAEALVKQVMSGISPSPLTQHTERSSIIRGVFLTGATGYLGSAVLRSLLEDSEVEVYALVRCDSAQQGMSRLIEVAELDEWWKEAYSSRIHICPGDLTAADLSLSETQTHHVINPVPGNCSRINAIIHCGAVVHYGFNLESLWASNVQSTLRLLAMTAESKSVSKFIFVSGGQIPTQQTDRSSLALEYGSCVTGYTRSKLISERAVQECMQHAVFEGKSLQVVKPGYIAGPRSTGRANRNDFVWRMVASCLQIGAFNEEDSGKWLCITDKLTVAGAISSALFSGSEGKSAESTIPICEGLRVSDLWQLLSGDMGYRLKAVRAEEWLDRLRLAVTNDREEQALFPLLDYVENCKGSLGCSEMDDAEYQHNALGVEMLRSNIKYLIREGFLPVPPRARDGREVREKMGMRERDRDREMMGTTLVF